MKQKVRFADYSDLDKHECTIEERGIRTSYRSKCRYICRGRLRSDSQRSRKEDVDVIIWDGGNNDFSFYKTDLYITVTDPHRAGHETTYYPGLRIL